MLGMELISPNWTQGFLFDLALEFDRPEDVCKKWGVTEEHYYRLARDPLFLKSLGEMHAKQRTEGKFAQLLAGAVLDDLAVEALADIIKGGETAPETKIKAIEELRNISGRSKAAAESAGGGFVVNMNFGAPALPVGGSSMMPKILEAGDDD